MDDMRFVYADFVWHFSGGEKFSITMPKSNVYMTFVNADVWPFSGGEILPINQYWTTSLFRTSVSIQ